MPATTAAAHESIGCTADGRFLIEAHLNNINELQIRERTRSRELQALKGEFCKIALSGDGRYLAAATTGTTIVLALF